MKHRHLDVPEHTQPERLPSAAIVDVFERGDLADWRPILSSIARDPSGELAERVLRLIDAFPMYGTSQLLRSWIRHRRDIETGRRAALGEARPVPLSVVRKRLGLTQAEVAARMGISQSDLSKLERRPNPRLSTLRQYADALGVQFHVVVASSAGQHAVVRFPESS